MKNTALVKSMADKTIKNSASTILKRAFPHPVSKIALTISLILSGSMLSTSALGQESSEEGDDLQSKGLETYVDSPPVNNRIAK